MKSTAAGALLSARISSPAFGVPGDGLGLERRSRAGRSPGTAWRTRGRRPAPAARGGASTARSPASRSRNGRRVTLAESISPSKIRCVDLDGRVAGLDRLGDGEGLPASLDLTHREVPRRGVSGVEQERLTPVHARPARTRAGPPTLRVSPPRSSVVSVNGNGTPLRVGTNGCCPPAACRCRA